MSDILILDDEKIILDSLKAVLEKDKHNVLCTNTFNKAKNLIEKNEFDLVISDIVLPEKNGIEILKYIKEVTPETPVIMITGEPNIDNAIQALRYNAYDFLIKPVSSRELRHAANRALEYKELRREVLILRKEVTKKYSFEGIISNNKEMKTIFDTISRIAKSNTSVMIQGESGTGKELIAKAIHYNSERSKSDFVAVDCGAMTESLLESELFGYVRGAFTGANKDKKGLFEEADGGTLFLDEIGNVSLNLQTKLLRALQEKEIRRVGGSKNIKVDVRIISATNKNLKELIRNEEFREDLYFRLAVVPIELPPLRERKEDIPHLINHFIDKYNKINSRSIRSISKDALDLLQRYSWPGNIRELENSIEYAMLMTDEDIIKPDAINLAYGNDKSIGQLYNEIDKAENIPLKKIIADVEEKLIYEALERTSWNKQKAAKLLEINRSLLYEKIAKYNITQERSN